MLKIVQTFWSGNKNDILRNSFGWYDTSYHIQSWALSCQLLKKLYDDVELYTDQAGYDLLIDKLKLPYSKVHVVLDELNHYPSSVWALSKIKTYSLQETPFIHVDGDVFLWKTFSDRLCQSDLVVQNREIGNPYFESSWKTLEENLLYIPHEIQEHRKKESEVNVLNFGIFGGRDIDFIQEYSKKAFEFVDGNLETLDQLGNLNFNIFFEQYLFYCMSQEKQVEGYFQQDFVADQYKGLANFQEVPIIRDYLHLLGDYKKKESICRLISRQLSIEFPEQYLRCLTILESEEQNTFKHIYKDGELSNETTNQLTFSAYYKSLSDTEKFSRTKPLLQKLSQHSIDKKGAFALSKHKLQKKLEESQFPILRKVFQHEINIDEYLVSIDNIDFLAYAKWQYQQTTLYPKFLQNSTTFLFESANLSTIIEAPLLHGEDPLLAPENPSEEISRLILPITQHPYYQEIIVDELEEAILHESKASIDLQDLTKVMQSYFDEEDIQNNYTNYKKLIQKSVMRLLFQGALNFTNLEKKFFREE